MDLKNKESDMHFIPALQVFNPAEHVNVARRILLYHILNVVRPERFFELLSSHKILNFSKRPYCFFVLLC